MKKILLIIVLALTTQTIIAQVDAFITTWVTTAGFETITLSAQPDAPNYTINWGDGISNTYTSTQVPSHIFVASGEHTVSFTGTFPHITFIGQTKLKAVQQWGNQKWTSMANMFESCVSLNSFPTQAPDLSLCNNLSSMFLGATTFNQPLDSWDVSNIIDMYAMFAYVSSFNQPIGSWNVSNVTNMAYMFYGASAFNQNIQAWDVSNVTDMNNMFLGATAFNQPIGSWDVSNVTNMYAMLADATAFNQPIGSWNVSNVTNMSYMFRGSPFNQPIGSWNVSNVTNMTNIFQNAELSSANYDALLIGWSTIIPNETPLKQNVIFSGGDSNYCNGVSARSSIISTYGWTITDAGLDCNGLPPVILDSNGVTIKYTGTTVPSPYFIQASPRGTLEWFAIVDNTTKSNITDYAKNIQSGIDYFTPPGESSPIPFNNIVTTFVTDMNSIFREASVFNQPIGSWDVSKVTDMNLMFFQAYAFNQPIGSWNLGNVTSMVAMFHQASSFNQPIGSWNVSNVTTMGGMFREASVFNQPIGSWDVSKVTDMTLMFHQATFNQPIGSWDVGNVTSMVAMFMDNEIFNQPLGSWNVSNVTTMGAMFREASVFNQNISSWNVSNVTDMNFMFYQAAAFNQPIGSWDVGKVTNMFVMFHQANSFNQPIGSWNVSSVTNMFNMFANATNFNQPLGSWDVSNVTDMGWMFADASTFNQAIGNWNVSQVTDMTGMFNRAATFNQDIGSWNVSNVTNMSYMFSLVGLSIANYDELLIGWSTISPNETPLKPNITFSGGNSKYCNGASARSSIISANGWTITDAGQDANCVLETETFEKNALKLYPNPVINILNIKTDYNLINQPFTIIDGLGRVVLNGKINEVESTINVEQLSKGIYYLKISDKNASKFVKE